MMNTENEVQLKSASKAAAALEEHFSTEGMKTLYPMIIDGQKIRTGRQIDVINPATRAVFASVARADEAVIDAAVAAAQRAFPAWSAMPLP